MRGVDFSIEIDRPPAAIFRFLADFSNDPRWRANVVEMLPLGRPTDALGGIWSRQVEVRKVPGRRLRTEAVITAFEPPRRIAFRRADGPIRPEGVYALSDLGGRTRLDFSIAVDLEGAARLLAPLVALLLAAVVRPALEGDFTRLKALLEQSRTGPEGPRS